MVKKIELDIETIFEDIHSIEMNDNTKELLHNGIPAYFKESGMANGIMTKLYPNGTKETVQIDEDFNETVVNL
ncbi:MAG: hypothetical protein HF962_01635 [Sulfurovum sp.]|nr:hypothetical protein [Sulfurovum sp.]